MIRINIFLLFMTYKHENDRLKEKKDRENINICSMLSLIFFYLNLLFFLSYLFLSLSSFNLYLLILNIPIISIIFFYSLHVTLPIIYFFFIFMSFFWVLTG